MAEYDLEVIWGNGLPGETRLQASGRGVIRPHRCDNCDSVQHALQFVASEVLVQLRRNEKLLQFLSYPGVPPTNNQSEQALRTSVIHRKVTNGFRSGWGANAYANLLSVIATSKIKGQRVFETLINLMGRPVLQYFDASYP